MRTFLRVLAILMLLITVAGAAVILYGVRTLQPEIEMIMASSLPADSADSEFQKLRSQVEDGYFVSDAAPADEWPEEAECSFVTYKIRVRNRGFFPDEWIYAETELLDGDLLRVPETGTYVLQPGTEGDLSVTILTGSGNVEKQRTFQVSAYILGKKMIVSQTYD